MKTNIIGYLTKLHLGLTNCTFLKLLLLDILNDVVINASLACELDPSMELHQNEVMSSGKIHPQTFTVWALSRISCRRDKDQITTDIIGIKCAILKAIFWRSFLLNLDLMETETCMGTFVPTRAVHMIGLEAYTKLLNDHNHFLHTVTTVPIGNFQHATLEIPFLTDANNGVEQTNLTKIILAQFWYLSLECWATLNRIMVITTPDFFLKHATGSTLPCQNCTNSKSWTSSMSLLSSSLHHVTSINLSLCQHAIHMITSLNKACPWSQQLPQNKTHWTIHLNLDL